MTPPARGFDVSEFESRTHRAQALMRAQGLGAILLTTEPEVRYFTGFLTQFWESPTRPWYAVVPATGKPVAVIPAIGAAGMRETWIDDVRIWSAPNPGDDGITLLAECIREIVGESSVVGVASDLESHLRMPLGDYQQLLHALGNVTVANASPVLQRVRYVKSEAEIEKIRFVCELTSGGFEELAANISIGMSERDICKLLRIDLLRRGADSVPYMIGASGSGSYDNIIMGPTDRVPARGDIMIIDTGARFDGYFCDFDRNYAFGRPSDAARRAHDVVYAATDAGFAAARPGVTTSDVYAAMWTVMSDAGALGNDVGRLGHGLGMQLTEFPSNRPGDETVLEPGVVLTLEPGMEFQPGQQMVHEENIVIREDGAEWLSRRAPAEMPIIL